MAVALLTLPNLAFIFVAGISREVVGLWLFSVALVLLAAAAGVRVRLLFWCFVPVLLMVPATLACLAVLKYLPSTFLFLALVESNSAELSCFQNQALWSAAGIIGLVSLYQWILLKWIPKDFRIGWGARSLVAGILLVPLAPDACRGAWGGAVLDTKQRWLSAFPTSTIAAAAEALSMRARVQERKDLVDNLEVRQEPSFASNDDRQLHMLVIGESAARNCFSLYGYERETTPLLQRTDNLMVFEDMSATATVTLMAVPQILTAIGPGKLMEATQEPSLLTAYRKAGYRVYWLSTQRKHGTFDTITSLFSEDAHEAEFLSGKLDVNGDGAYSARSDLALLPLVQNILAKKEDKVLLVLHTIGSHGPYTQRYTSKLTRFPVDKQEAMRALKRVSGSVNADAEDLQKVQDSYDNTIFATDCLLANLIHLLKGAGASSWLWYVSDHGENTSKSPAAKFVHGVVSPDVAFVPALAWLSPRYRENHPELVEALQQNLKAPASSASTFHTLLDLAGLSCDQMNPKLSLARSGFSSGPRIISNSNGMQVDLDQALAGTTWKRGGWTPLRSAKEKTVGMATTQTVTPQ